MVARFRSYLKLTSEAASQLYSHRNRQRLLSSHSISFAHCLIFLHQFLRSSTQTGERFPQLCYHQNHGIEEQSSFQSQKSTLIVGKIRVNTWRQAPWTKALMRRVCLSCRNSRACTTCESCPQEPILRLFLTYSLVLPRLRFTVI